MLLQQTIYRDFRWEFCHLEFRLNLHLEYISQQERLPATTLRRISVTLQYAIKVYIKFKVVM